MPATFEPVKVIELTEVPEQRVKLETLFMVGVGLTIILNANVEP